MTYVIGKVKVSMLQWQKGGMGYGQEKRKNWADDGLFCNDELSDAEFGIGQDCGKLSGNLIGNGADGDYDAEPD